MKNESSIWTEAEIRERLSISTIVFYRHRPLCEATLTELTKRGIYRIELLESPEQFDMAEKRSMRIMDDLFRSCGIQLIAYHADKTDFSDINSEQARNERVSLCKKKIDTMMELGGTVWGSHARKTDSIVMKSYEELARHVEGTDVTVAVENFPYEGEGVQDRVTFLDTLNHVNAGMILDIGHVRDDQKNNLLTVPGGPTKIINLCKKHLRHVHLHGYKDGSDHHPPMTVNDTIQWVELFSMLCRVNYRGAINFEPAGEPRHSTSIENTSRFPQMITELSHKPTA